MKRYSLIKFPVLAATVLVAFSACQKDTVSAPTLSVPVSLTVTGEGGSFSISYELYNSVSDGEIFCSSDESWITNFDVSGSDIVSFTVLGNAGTSLRAGNVRVTYSFKDGKTTRTVSQSTAIIQYGNGEPVISVEPSAVTASYREGSCSFDYSVYNPVVDGHIVCSADVDWVTDFDYSTDGTVEFTLSANEGTQLRTATIVLAYVYTGGEVTTEIPVVQYHAGASTGGGGDITDIVGTYTAHGTVFGSGYDNLTETDWEVEIFAYDGNDDYDAWCDGLVPYLSGFYHVYGDNRASAGVYVYADGRLHIPTQMTNLTVSAGGTTYYVGYTPCTGIDEGGFSADYNYPDLVFTYNDSTGKWESDYGMLMAGCTSNTITSMLSYFQAVTPTITLTKLSSSTSAVGSSSASGISDAVAHPLTEGLQGFSNFNLR